MIARYAIFDTRNDRDVKEFDDLSGAYAEIDRLKQRHGTRYAVRPAQERRERVQTAPALDLAPAPEPKGNRSAGDAGQFGAPIGWAAALQILEAIMHLRAAVDRLGQDLFEIRAALREAQPSAEGVLLRRPSATEPPAKHDSRRATAAVNAHVAKLGKKALSTPDDETSRRAVHDALMSNGSRSAALTELHKLLEEMPPDGGHDNPAEVVDAVAPPASPVTPQYEPEPLPDLRDGIIAAYRSGKITRAQAAEALVDAGITDLP